MMLRYDEQESAFMILPRETGVFLKFLTELGYNPKYTEFNRTCIVNDPWPIDYHHLLVEEWNKYTGYDKIKEKALKDWRQQNGPSPFERRSRD